MCFPCIVFLRTNMAYHIYHEHTAASFVLLARKAKHNIHDNSNLHNVQIIIRVSSSSSQKKKLHFSHVCGHKYCNICNRQRGCLQITYRGSRRELGISKLKCTQGPPLHTTLDLHLFNLKAGSSQYPKKINNTQKVFGTEKQHIFTLQ